MQRRIADKLRKKQKRLNESDDDKLLHISKQKQFQQQQSDVESETERLARLEKLKQVQKQRLENKSEIECFARLEKLKQVQKHRLEATQSDSPGWRCKKNTIKIDGKNYKTKLNKIDCLRETLETKNSKQ